MESRTLDATQRTYEYMRSHTGIVVYARDIEKATGMKRISVQNSLGRMAAIPGYHVYRISRGAYMYHPNGTPEIAETETAPVIPPKAQPQKPSRKVYEFVGHATKDYDLIRDEMDILYVAIPFATYMNAPLSQR